MLGFSSTTTDKDMGAEAILAEVRQMDGAIVDAGLFEGEKHDEGAEITLPQIGAVHEFGYPQGNIPSRPWMSRAARERDARWEAAKVAALEGVFHGIKVIPSLFAFGERVASDIRATIDEVLSPPKAESTLRREGGPLKRTKTGALKKGAHEHQLRFTHPLIWTGLMRASVRARLALRSGLRKLSAKGRAGGGQ